MAVLPEIVRAIESNRRAAIATIIATSGSTPASAFSKMLVIEGNDKTIGTVGGGCVEADVVAAARECLATNRARILKFDLTEDEFVQGLICGGTVEILLEPVNAAHSQSYRDLLAHTRSGMDCLLATRIEDNGSVTRKELLVRDGVRKQGDVPSEEGVEKAFRRGETQRIAIEGGAWILEPVAGTPRLILFGAGHVSRAICKSAAAVGFRVAVVDDRDEYANAGRFPEASEIIVAEFSDVCSQFEIHNSDFAIICTRGHRYDEEILEEVLQFAPRYIGMIGSQRKVLTTYKRLMNRGVSVETLKQVCSPMGLVIGAVTPEEIAVSVTAELIAVRRNVFDRTGAKSAAMARLVDATTRASSTPAPLPAPTARSLAR